MKRSSPLALGVMLLAGCGGGAFSEIDTDAGSPVVDDAGTEAGALGAVTFVIDTGPAPALDAGADAGEAGPPERPDAAAADASDARVDSADSAPAWVCTRVRVPSRPDAGPFGCDIGAIAAASVVPSKYAIVLSRTAGCELADTPADCQCAETYTCACLQAHDPCHYGATWLSCDDSTGAPTVQCP